MGRSSSFSRAVCLALGSIIALNGNALAAEDLPQDLMAKKKVVTLKPYTPWNIDFGESRCRLTRLFGTKDDQHLLMFEQDAPSGSFGLTFAGSQVKRFRNGRDLKIGAERDEAVTVSQNFGKGDVAGFGPAIILSAYSIGSFDEEASLLAAGIDLKEAATIDRFVLSRGGDTVSFETGDMMPPFQALNTCTVSLLAEWGLDAEKHQAYSKPEWLNAETVSARISSSYPSDALRRGEQAIFRMRVIVEADGSVSDCFIEASTIAKTLDSPACREMMKAQFLPARDKNGVAMRSFYATTVRYAIG